MAEPIGYTADLDPHGRVNGYEFHLDDGTSLYSFGPHADALARDIDSMPDTRTADASGAPFQVPQMGGLEAPVSREEVADIAPNVPVAPPPPKVAEGWVTQGVQPGSVDKTPRVPTLQRATAAGKPLVDMASAPELPLSRKPGGAAPAGRFDAEINAPTPYSAGVSPQQMLSRGAYVPTERTTEDAVPYDQEAAVQRSDAELNFRLAEQQRVELETAKLAEQANILKAQQPELVDRALQAKHDAVGAENRYQDERSHLQTLIDAQRARRVDPNQMWAEKGTLGTIGIVAGLALSQWGASMGHTQNYFGQVVSDAIEHSIRAQEAAIASGQQGINNALSELDRVYGDRDQAKQALRIALNDIAEAKAGEVAARLGTQEAQINLQAWLAGREKLRANEESKFRELSVGKQKMTEKFTQPKPGGGGGPPSIFEKAKRAKAGAEITKAEREISGGSLEEPSLKRIENISEKLAPLSKLDQAIKEVGKAGVERNEAAVARRLPGGEVIPGVASLVGHKGAQRLESQRGAWGDFVSAEVAEESGSGVSNDEFARRVKNKEGEYGSEAAKQAALNRAKAKVQAKTRTLLQGLSPAERAELGRRHGQVLIEEAEQARKAPRKVE